MSVYAYRFFTNTCREAMSHYQKIFGGDLFVMGFGEMPPGEDVPEGFDPNFVMHAALTFPDGGMLMASDDPSRRRWPGQGCLAPLHRGHDRGGRAHSSRRWPKVARPTWRSRRSSGRSGSAAAPTATARRGWSASITRRPDASTPPAWSGSVNRA